VCRSLVRVMAAQSNLERNRLKSGPVDLAGLHLTG